MTDKGLTKAGAVAAEGTVALQSDLGRVVEGIKHVANCIKTIREQKTEQTRIDAEARKEVERVQAVREVLMSYLDRSFDERRRNFDALFTRLDAALESESLGAVSATLDAIVKIADSSPFKALNDIQATQKVLKDKSKEWDL
ncbi:MAG: hypothetical protein KF718_05335 [Polyangiaceae bacterium]|nr:hypothetical protein [Polyangiaceae bacterium]